MVDVSILWDNKPLLWVSQLFARLRAGAADEPLWPFAYPEVLETVRKAGAELEMPWMAPYTLRHAGVSWDILQRCRTLSEAQKRGQWRSAPTMDRYEQHARLARDALRISPAMREHFTRCEVHLRSVLLGREPVLCPPRS